MAGFSDITFDLNGELDGLFRRFFLGAQFLKDEMQERIFEDGYNASGTKVQSVKSYSTKEAYFSVLPRKTNNVGKRGKPIKSSYFPQGYSEMKQTIGRPPLELFGRLKSAFVNTGLIEGDNSVVFQVAGFGGQIEGLDNLYKTVFEPSESEVDNYTQYMLSDE
jgi:hypothetical protein